MARGFLCLLRREGKDQEEIVDERLVGGELGRLELTEGSRGEDTQVPVPQKRSEETSHTTHPTSKRGPQGVNLQWPGTPVFH